MNFLTWMSTCSNAIVAFSVFKSVAVLVFCIWFCCFFPKFILDKVLKVKKGKKYVLYFILGIVVSVVLVDNVLPLVEVLADSISNLFFGDFSGIESYKYSSSIGAKEITRFSVDFVSSCLLLLPVISYAYFSIVNGVLQKNKNKNKINKKYIYIVYAVIIVVVIIAAVFIHNHIINDVDNMWVCTDTY